MKSTATKHDPASPAIPKTESSQVDCPSGRVPTDHIATAAYYRAQSRGFAPGKEVEDWLEAEAQLLQKATV